MPVGEKKNEWAVFRQDRKSTHLGFTFPFGLYGGLEGKINGGVFSGAEQRVRAVIIVESGAP